MFLFIYRFDSTAYSILMFIVSSSLALLFFLNPSCPDQPLHHKVSYITSLSSAVRVVPFTHSEHSNELFDLLLF